MTAKGAELMTTKYASLEETRVLLCEAVLSHSLAVKDGEHGHSTYVVVYDLINDLITKAKEEGASSS